MQKILGTYRVDLETKNFKKKRPKTQEQALTVHSVTSLKFVATKPRYRKNAILDRSRGGTGIYKKSHKTTNKRIKKIRAIDTNLKSFAITETASSWTQRPPVSEGNCHHTSDTPLNKLTVLRA